MREESAMHTDDVNTSVARLLQFLETGETPPGLFVDDVVLDFTPPRWHVQTRGIEAGVALRRSGHPVPGRVTRHRVDPTPTGYVIEFEEAWSDAKGDWTSREMARADLRGDSICHLSVYCTGDWDAAQRERHATATRLTG
jgi:hypothetical protein